MVTLLKVTLVVFFSLFSALSTAFAQTSKYQDNNFKRRDKAVYSIWPSIPFFPLGDIGQYEKTMAQDRDRVRQMLWGELMGAAQKLAETGVAVEVMIEPMANILMMFDQVHDAHKAKDVIDIDKSLEAQFKAAFDQLFRTYDVRDDRRRVQISAGTETSLLQSYIRGISSARPLGKKITAAEVNSKMALEMFEQIDYVSYGTFSSLGRGNFQLTFHLIGNRNGVSRSFIATGRLTEALNDLANQVFDFFQKNAYPDWETPYKKLSWLAMPVNPAKGNAYTWEEAFAYCRARGYRLPYSREMIMAESGGHYKEGGISGLDYNVSYAVADKRLANTNYVYTAGNEAASGGPVQGASYSMTKGKFWCVKGDTPEEIQIYETVWALIRKYYKDREIYRALETVRYEIGDYASDGTIFWSGMLPKIEALERMGSLDEALGYLRYHGISLKIPSSITK